MAAHMKVRLIGKSNGVGLSRDFELLAAALRDNGCEVTLYGCERRDRKRRRSFFTRLAARARGLRGGGPDAPYDVNLMLEHMWPQFLHEATRNVLVPNPEWFDRRDVAFLSAAQRVWAKTALAERLFAARGCRAVRIGFDSADRLDPAVTRENKFLHLAGRSPLKGTARLHALWQRHPEWPTLTIVQDAEAVASPTPAGAANICVQSRFLSDEALRMLQNSHRFHVCTSEAEGWGHYIVEAMSVGAVTLTCDAPPMNELINPKRGVLLAVQNGERHNLATLSLFDEAALEAAVTRALAMSSAACETIGAAARAWFLDNKQGFSGRVRHALEELQT
jgi:glycosyltransferase involved in cell wall biosynthesis